jgi:hypothetical protein
MKRLIPLLALPLLALAPLPADSAQRILLHAPTPHGLVDIYASEEGWSFVRLASGGDWIGPLSPAMLDAVDGQQEATVGTTFCTTTIVHVPGGQTLVYQSEVEIEEHASTLDHAVSKAKEKIKAALPTGTFVTPCPASNKMN